MKLDSEIQKDLDKWNEILKFDDDQLVVIVRHLKGMKMSEFQSLIDMVTIKPNGDRIDLWFEKDNFTPVTLLVYYLNIRPLTYIMENIWNAKYTDRTRTTKIIAALPYQKTRYAKRYDFTHHEKQGISCPKTKYKEKRDKRLRYLFTNNK